MRPTVICLWREVEHWRNVTIVVRGRRNRGTDIPPVVTPLEVTPLIQ